MTAKTHSVDFTTEQLRLIEAALATQEKILSVQSRAGQDETTAQRLLDLQALKRSVRQRLPAHGAPAQSWSDKARAWFG